VTVDEAGFDAAMDARRPGPRGRQVQDGPRAGIHRRANTFTGYDKLASRPRSWRCTPMAQRERAPGRPDGVVVLDTRPFYAESGGQVGDQGVIAAAARFAVEDTQKIKADVFGHHGVLEAGSLKVGDAVRPGRRRAARATMRNHSVTHLMHKALREVLGSHVQQRARWSMPSAPASTSRTTRR
jgi:alanyl-tRNA synthetase